ncbi:MAG: hypothetical protein E7420_04060 [Ruminococcaceae bacterium]|nr:hypothetical protein [Oscillospiraceae bacterium]
MFAASVAPSAGRVSVSGGNLNIRSSPTSSSAIVSKAANGAYLTLHSRNGEWWYVEYDDGKFGYCHSAYVIESGGKARKVYTNFGALNVRGGAGTNHAIIGKLSKGEIIVLLSSDTYWAKILYNGNKIGYVYNTYLGPVSSGVLPPSSVSLSVPSFKQYDSRWANVKIGSQGKTMAQIGCATTAISMMESHRLGKTVTPSEMKNRLSYTSAGNVYWPENYTAVTDKTNYLTKISSLLNEGKPVLIGLKNSYGSQHWVVITGYINGGTKAEDFRINDPGSETKTNLSQLLNTHPNFYKFFYY